RPVPVPGGPADPGPAALAGRTAVAMGPTESANRRNVSTRGGPICRGGGGGDRPGVSVPGTGLKSEPGQAGRRTQRDTIATEHRAAESRVSTPRKRARADRPG